MIKIRKNTVNIIFVFFKKKKYVWLAKKKINLNKTFNNLKNYIKILV